MKISIYLLVLISMLVTKMDTVYAQKDETAQLLLNVEKLAQLKAVLKNMEAGYKILNAGYRSVKDITEGNFSLHQAFLNGLLQVSPSVRKYKRVADIVTYQKQLLTEYQSAFGRFRQSGQFSPDEVLYMQQVYGRLLNQSLYHLEELAMIVTARKLRMSDGERLKAIDRIYTGMADKLSFLRSFNARTATVADMRQRQHQDMDQLKQLHGKP